MPHLYSTIARSILVVFLLANAEVVTVLLLRPPGEDSYPVSIFTWMANAPVGLISALCLLYVLGVLSVMMPIFQFLISKRGRYVSA